MFHEGFGVQSMLYYLPLDTMFPISAVRAKSPFSFLLRTCWTSHQGIYLNITTYLCT